MNTHSGPVCMDCYEVMTSPGHKCSGARYETEQKYRDESASPPLTPGSVYQVFTSYGRITMTAIKHDREWLLGLLEKGDRIWLRLSTILSISEASQVDRIRRGRNGEG